MSDKTVQYKRTIRGSVGAGVGSLFNGNGRRYYVLEHKAASKFHKAGEAQKIIIDEIEMGREASCQVRFDDTFSTVSRRHAAIVRDGDKWKLVQLSKTNSTFLNGKKIETEWYLGEWRRDTALCRRTVPGLHSASRQAESRIEHQDDRASEPLP